MVERIVLLKLVSELATPNGRAEVAAESARWLARVPGVKGVVTRVAADEATEGSWDVAMHVQFADVADVAPYLVDPVHVDFVQSYLTPRITFKKAWNFSDPA